MSRDHDLAIQANKFAAELKKLLNRTVCNGAHVGSFIAPDGRAVVGTRLDRARLDSEPVRLATPSSAASCWLNVSCRLFIDSRGYLTVDSSVYGIYVGKNAEHELFHYDYERDKDAYTEAHLQVIGTSDSLQTLMKALDKPKVTLRRLHFPVGGRRFRPALEDVLEFLINEGIAAPAADWKSALDASRDKFRDNQLKAAIARKPEIAVEVLQKMEYSIKAPAEESTVVNMLGRSRKRRKKGG